MFKLLSECRPGDRVALPPPVGYTFLTAPLLQPDSHWSALIAHDEMGDEAVECHWFVNALLEIEPSD